MKFTAMPFFFRLILFLLFVNPVFLLAQEPHPLFKNYTTEDGLPSSEIYCSIQDLNGNLWLGTDRGLVRFDGYEFKTFSTKDGLTDNTVFYLFVDKQNRVWMFTFSGRIFYFENEKIISYKYNDIILSNSNNRIPWGFYVDSLNQVTFSLRDRGILNIDSVGKLTVIDTVFVALDSHYKIQEFEKGYGIISVSPSLPQENEVIVRHTYKGKNFEYKIKTFESARMKFVRVNEGEILFSLGRNLFSVKEGIVKELFSAPLLILSLIEDKQENLWIGTEDGIYFFNKGDWGRTPKIFLKQNTITSIFQDKEDGYWFTSLENGLFYLPDFQISNIQLSGNIQKPISLATDFKNKIYIGCWTGAIVKYESGKLSTIYELEDTTIKLPITDLSSFPGDPIIYVSRYYSGRIVNDKFLPFKAIDPLGVKSDFIRTSSNNIYAAGSVLIFKVDKDSLTINQQTNQRINSIAEAGGSNFIVGGNRGVTIANGVLEEEKPYRIEFSEMRIDDIKKVGKKIVFATRGNGLMIQSNDSIYKIDETNGLTSNLTSKLTVEKNSVWVATNKGVSKITFTSDSSMNYTIQNIHHSDGLLSDVINEVVVLNDTVYVATNPGISLFNVNSSFVNDSPPPIYISSMKVNAHEINLKEQMNFEHDSNNIHIGFTAISFKSFENIIYQYQLIHEEDTLSSTTTNREVEFLTLAPGKYNFVVIAKNASGFWSTSPAELKFIIHPAWWQTLWFKLLLSLFITALIFVYFRNQILIVKRKVKVEQEQASLQLTAIRAQMNPHFIFNVMNSIRIYMQNHDMRSAEKYLTSFSKLVRYVLDNSDKQVVSLEDELNALKNYTELEMQQFENGFKFEVETEKGIDLDEYELPSLLLQPFVENAIKHGISRMNSGGEIKIIVKRNGHGLLIAIQDNGVGFKEAVDWNNLNREPHISKGTQLIFQRIEAYNKCFGKQIKARIVDLKDESGKSKGTRAEVEI